jgi:hypothetical protein
MADAPQEERNLDCPIEKKERVMSGERFSFGRYLKIWWLPWLYWPASFLVIFCFDAAIRLVHHGVIDSRILEHIFDVSVWLWFGGWIFCAIVWPFIASFNIESRWYLWGYIIANIAINLLWLLLTFFGALVGRDDFIR